MTKGLGPLSFEGTHVRLVPFEERHLDDLEPLLADHEAYQWVASFDTHAGRPSLEGWYRGQLADIEAGRSRRFAVITRSDGRVVGTTSFFDYSERNASLEIGGTFYARRVWRSAVNTECKRLLLGHAFDALGCERVMLKTDARNERSQNAIARLGAVREGTLRKHQRMANGYLRDTVIFSIIRSEWLAVRARLDGFLARR